MTKKTRLFFTISRNTTKIRISKMLLKAGDSRKNIRLRTIPTISRVSFMVGRGKNFSNSYLDKVTMSKSSS